MAPVNRPLNSAEDIDRRTPRLPRLVRIVGAIILAALAATLLIALWIALA